MREVDLNKVGNCAFLVIAQATIVVGLLGVLSPIVTVVVTTIGFILFYGASGALNEDTEQVTPVDDNTTPEKL